MLNLCLLIIHTILTYSLWGATYPSLKTHSPDLGGPHFNLQGGVVFVGDKLFICIRLGRALKIKKFTTSLYRTVLEVNYLFHAESARQYLFKKKTPVPPCGPHIIVTHLLHMGNRLTQ